jgi:two-component system response regulator HydG
VRQLRNVIERMVVLAAGDRLTRADVPAELRAPAPRPVPAGRADAPAPAANGGSLADSEREKILAVLASCGGNKSKAADILGISRRTIHRKLKEWRVS